MASASEVNEIVASLSHIQGLDDEARAEIVEMILESRAINAQLRAREIAFAQPFIDDGIVSLEDLEGLSFEQVRALVWQVRKCLDKDHPLRRVVIPRTNPGAVKGKSVAYQEKETNPD